MERAKAHSNRGLALSTTKGNRMDLRLKKAKATATWCPVCKQVQQADHLVGEVLVDSQPTLVTRVDTKLVVCNRCRVVLYFGD